MTGRGRGFDSVADTYDEARPEYPPRVLDVVADAVGGLAGVRVLDLAAGTGLATRALLERGATVVATDPGLPLLATLRRRSPATPVVAAVAEALPFAAATLDLVVCATAWHWVAAGPTTAELTRVLRPGGALALWWANNRHGDGVPWEDAQSAVYASSTVRHGSRPPSHSGVGPWEAAEDLRSRGWHVVAEERVAWAREVTVEEHLRVLSTHSDVLALGDDGPAFLAEVARAIEPFGPTLTERLHGPVVVAQPPLA